ncbi:MAG TPA: ABATE domain-containing protein, partial [Euzebyales bacterium]|nr:ABATE domain-containing protein [Euzebyales bacterium]
MNDPKTRPYVWQSIGGHIALDLANTVSWRLDRTRRVDRLDSPASLVDWYAAVVDDTSRRALDRSTATQPDRAERATRRVRDLRAATIRVIDAHLGKSAAPVADVELLA